MPPAAEPLRDLTSVELGVERSVEPSPRPASTGAAASRRIEALLHRALEPSEPHTPTPPKLRDAMRHAVMAGGARLRPLLCFAVAEALDARSLDVVDAMATSVELMHAASLVHDDLPCFDDAATRRGQPTVHKRHGEAIAVLTGDALLLLALEVAGEWIEDPRVAREAMLTLTRAAGTPNGLVAGQAWESEPSAPAALYRRQKTGALFEAAAAGGALAAGVDPTTFRRLGSLLGEAYQIADDVLDVQGGETGKPTGRDRALGRPNLALELGVERATRALFQQLERAELAVPEVARREPVQRYVAGLRARIERVLRAA